MRKASEHGIPGSFAPRYAENIGMNRHFKDLGVYRSSVFCAYFTYGNYILRRILMDAWIEISVGQIEKSNSIVASSWMCGLK